MYTAHCNEGCISASNDNFPDYPDNLMSGRTAEFGSVCSGPPSSLIIVTLFLTHSFFCFHVRLFHWHGLAEYA
jgi:hypothetical protein